MVHDAMALYKQDPSPFTFIGLKKEFPWKKQYDQSILISALSIECGIVGHIYFFLKVIIEDYET